MHYYYYYYYYYHHHHHHHHHPLSLRTEHRVSTVPRHPRLLFQFLGSIRHLIGLFGGGISPAQGLYLHRTTQHNTGRPRRTSMPRAGFEHAIPIFERPKTVLGLDRLVIETDTPRH
jgi:hypothetical protein